jgi:hypothetical protein
MHNANTVFQRECQSTRDYLGLCNAFIKELTNVVEGHKDSDQYGVCLYDKDLGEQEQPYTTAYFAILIDVVLSRCRTSKWGTEGGVGIGQ